MVGSISKHKDKDGNTHKEKDRQKEKRDLDRNTQRGRLEGMLWCEERRDKQYGRERGCGDGE